MKRETASQNVAPAASHDVPFPPALLDFMMKKWRPAAPRLPPTVKGLQRFASRRAALSAAFPKDILVIPTGHEKVRANDTHYPFRPGSDFYYLTGNMEPDCVLIMWPQRRGGGHEAILLVEPNPGRRDATFFTDRNKGELWVGPRLGIAESAHRFGVSRCAALSTLADLLGSVKTAPCRVLRGVDSAVDAAVAPQPEVDKALAAHLSEMRLVKDSMEIKALQRACASTRRGFEDVILSLKNAKSEREVEGVFNLRARVEGNAVGYNTIAASGKHACILHWSHNTGALRRQDLILVDAGVEGRDLYTADVTRTLPISGTFSPAQRQIYDLVLAAQTAGLAAVKPGNDFMAANRACMEVLCAGLEALGILRVPAAEALLPENQFYKRYTLHNVSHMLGIDVHDCAQARQQTYKYGALKPGMVLTVEPGLYFQHDDATVPARFRGIGVRIEDDVVVTPRGCKILSDLPRRAVDVEKWMKAVWRRGKPSPYQ